MPGGIDVDICPYDSLHHLYLPRALSNVSGKGAGKGKGKGKAPAYPLPRTAREGDDASFAATSAGVIRGVQPAPAIRPLSSKQLYESKAAAIKNEFNKHEVQNPECAEHEKEGGLYHNILIGAAASLADHGA